MTIGNQPEKREKGTIQLRLVQKSLHEPSLMEWRNIISLPYQQKNMIVLREVLAKIDFCKNLNFDLTFSEISGFVRIYDNDDVLQYEQIIDEENYDFEEPESGF